MQTPDPALTTEQVVALATTIVTSLVVLFKLNISDAQQGALLALIGTGYTIFTLVHAAVVRQGRAKVAAARLVVDGNDQNTALKTVAISE